MEKTTMPPYPYNLLNAALSREENFWPDPLTEEDSVRFQKALSLVDGRDRIVLIKKYRDKKSINEIANEIDLTVTQIRYIEKHALAALHESLEKSKKLEYFEELEALERVVADDEDDEYGETVNAARDHYKIVFIPGIKEAQTKVFDQTGEEWVREKKSIDFRRIIRVCNEKYTQGYKLHTIIKSPCSTKWTNAEKGVENNLDNEIAEEQISVCLVFEKR